MSNSALRYLWPHFDCGNSQVCAAFAHALGAPNLYTLRHGDKVGKATFRIVEKDFRKDWLHKNMPALKVEWERRCKGYFSEAAHDQ